MDPLRRDHADIFGDENIILARMSDEATRIDIEMYRTPHCR
jgi:hypothetical protein